MWEGGRTTNAKDEYNGETRWWAWSSGGDITCAIEQSRTILLKNKENSFFLLKRFMWDMVVNHGGLGKSHYTYAHSIYHNQRKHRSLSRLGHGYRKEHATHIRVSSPSHL